MLTGKLVRVRYARDRVIPWYLDAQDAETLQLADELLEVFRAHVGATRGQLEEEMATLFGDLPQPIVHQGLAKLLEDRCDFEMQPGEAPEALREAAFLAATRLRRTDPFDRERVLREVAGERGIEPGAVDGGLFADLKSEQRLVRLDDTTAPRLIERYNVALAQAVLLRAVDVTITVQGESPQRYRQLFRQAKFRRLICEVEAAGPRTYRLKLDGPLSLFSATQKYGLQLALFLPAVVACDKFTLEADLRWGPDRRPKKLVLTPEDGLVSHQSDAGLYVPPEVGMFVELFRKKVADWEIDEATEIVPLGRSFWVPDFRVVHKPSGQDVLLDILGFWRRSSVARQLELLRAHAERPFLLALADALRVEEGELEELPGGVVRFRSLPLAEEVAREAYRVLFPDADEPAKSTPSASSERPRQGKRKRASSEEDGGSK